MLPAITRWTRIAVLIADNWRKRLRSSLGTQAGVTGLTHTVFTVSQSIEYIDRVFQDYLEYGELNENLIRNARILELGPGDNLGVALRFLALGARQVVCLDKFQYRSADGDERQRQIYESLRDSLPDEQRKCFDAAVTLNHGVKFNPALRCLYGSGAEDCDRPLTGEQFDLILSRAVLHEVFDIDCAFAAMDRLLAPGGRMIHKIDLRDYGMFTALGMHAREFLTVPDFIYNKMVKHSARPNRRMINYYRDKMRDLGYDAKLYISCIARHPTTDGEDEIRPHKTHLTLGIDFTDADLAMNANIRPRLRAPFSQLTDEELLAGGLMLVGMKPL